MKRIIMNTLKWAKLEANYNNRNILCVIASMIVNYLLYGVFPQEYFHFGFYKLNSAQKKTFFTTKEYARCRKKYSIPSYEEAIFFDKWIFSKVFSEYFGRGIIRIGSETKEQEILSFISNSTGSRFVYKPNKAHEGIGIKTIDINYKDDSTVLLQLKALPEGLLEEWIVQSNKMNDLYPNGVNCIRVYTFIQDGVVSFLDAKVTFGVTSNIVNATLGNNLFALVDVKSGVVISDLANYDMEVYKEHPVTGFTSKGLQLPMWREVLELVEKSARIVPQVAYVGWEIALTERGPILIEGNHCGGSGGNQFSVLRTDSKGIKDIWYR